MTKQQEFIRFLNNVNLTRYMNIRNACIETKELAFCENSWAKFMSGTWSIPDYFLPTMWKIVDDTFPINELNKE